MNAIYVFKITTFENAVRGSPKMVKGGFCHVFTSAVMGTKTNERAICCAANAQIRSSSALYSVAFKLSLVEPEGFATWSQGFRNDSTYPGPNWNFIFIIFTAK